MNSDHIYPKPDKWIWATNDRIRDVGTQLSVNEFPPQRLFDHFRFFAASWRIQVTVQQKRYHVFASERIVIGLQVHGVHIST